MNSSFSVLNSGLIYLIISNITFSESNTEWCKFLTKISKLTCILSIISQTSVLGCGDEGMNKADSLKAFISNTHFIIGFCTGLHYSIHSDNFSLWDRSPDEEIASLVYFLLPGFKKSYVWATDVAMFLISVSRGSKWNNFFQENIRTKEKM